MYDLSCKAVKIQEGWGGGGVTSKSTENMTSNQNLTFTVHSKELDKVPTLYITSRKRKSFPTSHQNILIIQEEEDSTVFTQEQ